VVAKLNVDVFLRTFFAYIFCCKNMFWHLVLAIVMITVITVEWYCYQRCARLSSNMCVEKYGIAPEVKVTGHIATVFPYIVSPLDYILHEILKNSMR